MKEERTGHYQNQNAEGILAQSSGNSFHISDNLELLSLLPFPLGSSLVIRLEGMNDANNFTLRAVTSSTEHTAWHRGKKLEYSVYIVGLSYLCWRDSSLTPQANGKKFNLEVKSRSFLSCIFLK